MKPPSTSKRFSKLHLNLYQVEANQKTVKNEINTHPQLFWCHLKIMLFFIIILEYDRLFLAMVLQ